MRRERQRGMGGKLPTKWANTAQMNMVSTCNMLFVV